MGSNMESGPILVLGERRKWGCGKMEKESDGSRKTQAIQNESKRQVEKTKFLTYLSNLVSIVI